MKTPTRPPAFLARLRLADLLRLAANNAGEELAAHALARAVGELLEVELEHRTAGRHDNPGYAKASPLAFAGLGGGDTARGPSDRVEVAAERHRGACAWRGLALELLAPLRERNRRAALVSAYLIPPTGAARRSPRMMTAAEACRPETLADIYRRLGWEPTPSPGFANATALANAAGIARRKMRDALAERLAAAAASPAPSPAPGEPAP